MTAKLNPDLIGRIIEDEEELQRREQAGKEVAENIEQLKSFLLDNNYTPTDDDIYKARVILDTVKGDNLTLEGYDNKIVDRLIDFVSRKATDDPDNTRQEKSDKTLSAEDALIVQEVDEILQGSDKYPERDIKFLKKCKKLLQDNPEKLTDKMKAEINEIKIRIDDEKRKKEKLREGLREKVVKILQDIEVLTNLGKESFDYEDWGYLRSIKNILIQGPDIHPLAFKQDNFKIIDERIKEIKKKVKSKVKKSKSTGSNDVGNDRNNSRNNIPKAELEEMQRSAFEDFVEKDLDNNIDRLKGQINKIEEELIEIKEWQKSHAGDSSFRDSYLRFVELRNELAKLKDNLKKLQSIERPSKVPNKKSTNAKDLVKIGNPLQETPEVKVQKESSGKNDVGPNKDKNYQETKKNIELIETSKDNLLLGKLRGFWGNETVIRDVLLSQYSNGNVVKICNDAIDFSENFLDYANVESFINLELSEGERKKIAEGVRVLKRDYMKLKKEDEFNRYKNLLKFFEDKIDFLDYVLESKPKRNEAEKTKQEKLDTESKIDDKKVEPAPGVIPDTPLQETPEARAQKENADSIKVKEPKVESEVVKPESDKEAIREIYAKLREEMASRQVDSNIDTSTPQNHRENNEPDIPDQPINRAINQEEQGFFKKHWPKLLVNAVAWTGISIATLIAIFGFGKKGEVSEAPANGTAKAEANPGAKSTAEVVVTSTLDIVQSPVSTQNPVETATQATTPVAETSNSAPAVETIAPVANTPARVVEKSGIEVQNYEGVENAYTASLQASVLGSRVVQINNGSFLIDLGDRIDKLGYKIEKSQLVEIEKIENRFMGLSRNVRGFNINAKDFAIRNNLSNEIKNFIRKNCNKVSQGELPPQLRDKMQDRNSLEQREHLARINAIRDKVNKGEELKEAEYDFAQRNEEELGFKVEK